MFIGADTRGKDLRDRDVGYDREAEVDGSGCGGVLLVGDELTVVDAV